ncbi:retrovirus-related Pol polyprotein from transposon TNT 1-94 [Trichonephila clavipes]|nr:retrovirus-related Pol polyprotein from transposon TNT 1-94 [Trichonephila clavipes]
MLFDLFRVKATQELLVRNLIILNKGQVTRITFGLACFFPKTSEGRNVRSGYLPFRTNASILRITPKRSSSSDVGTSSYRYHTTTYSPASVSANRRTNDTIFVASMVTNEGRKVRSGYLPFRTYANTLPITPKPSSSRDVGASSYRYHTATLPHFPNEMSRTFFTNSVASTLNRVTGMEFNNQISVLTPNNWNTWKHDMQVLLMHYGCWQFIIQTKQEQPDEEATYKEKLDLQLHQFFGTKYQPGEDVGIFISRVKTAATRLQEAGHKLDDLYIGFQLIRWLPQEFQSTVQQIYRWKEEDFRVVKIEAELILEANRLQLMKQDLEKAENAYVSSFTSKKSKTRYLVLRLQLMEIQMARMITKRKVPDHYIIPKSKEISFFSDITAKTKNGSIEIWHQRFCHVNNDYLVKTSKNDSVKGLPRLTDNGKTHCIPCKLAKSKRVSFKKDGGRKIKTSIGIVAYGPLWSNAN